MKAMALKLFCFAWLLGLSARAAIPQAASQIPSRLESASYNNSATFTLMASTNRTSITITPTAMTLTAPTASDYFTGYKDNAANFSYTVTGTAGSTTLSRQITVSIYSTASVLGGSKPIGDLQLKLSTQPTTSYASLSCCAGPGVTIDSFSYIYKGAGDPTTRTVNVRMLLKGSTDAPATYTTGATGLVFNLAQIAP